LTCCARSLRMLLAGLRQSYEILHWSKANSKRQVLI